MAQNGTTVQTAGSWITINPWFVLTSSLALAILALMTRFVTGDSVIPVRAFLILGSMVAAVGAISLRLQAATWQFEERVRSSALVVGAALIGLVNYVSMDNRNWVKVFDGLGLQSALSHVDMSTDWDSVRLVVRVFVMVSFAGSVIILFNKLFQRIVISFLVVFHFVGILSAVTCVAPPNSAFAPWISMQLWVRVFRPYLYFMYLTNAYHFYSPDPGPATLLWFYVKFEDGTAEWYRLADKKDFSTRQEYQRMLAITESTNAPLSQPFLDNDKLRAHELAVTTFGPVRTPYSRESIRELYREPNVQAKDMTRSFAKYVANHYQSKDNPAKQVASVKVYRVTHMIINADSLAADIDPWDPTMYLPYYHGEFDKDGNILDPKSPYLYWLLPRIANPKPETPARYLGPGKRPPAKYLEYKDHCEEHAQQTGPDRPN